MLKEGRSSQKSSDRKECEGREQDKIRRGAQCKRGKASAIAIEQRQQQCARSPGGKQSRGARMRRCAHNRQEKPSARQ